MVSALEGKTEENKASDDKRGGNPDGNETGLGLQAAWVASYVEKSNDMVEPVTGEFTQDGGNDESKIEIS